MSTVPSSGEAGERDDEVVGVIAPPPPDSTYTLKIAPAALYGPFGELVERIAPYTESDPAAILIQLLVGWGNIAGPIAGRPIEGDWHPARLWAVLVGRSAMARKGTSWSRAKQVLGRVDPDWLHNQIFGGLVSGEGVIWHVRDMDPSDGKSLDKRMQLVEREFGAVLAVMARDKGNTVSQTIRNLWDDGTAQTMGKQNPCKTTGAHVSLIGHITEAELLERLTRMDISNGFANRILWIRVQRSQSLPFGGDNLDPRDLAPATEALTDAALLARSGRVQRVDFTTAARRLWLEVYDDLTQDRPGLLDDLLSRAAAQVVRISLTYALADQSDAIDVDHLRAGLAVWELADRSARQIFQGRTGNPLADRINGILKAAPQRTMKRNELRDALGRNYDSDATDIAVDVLKRLGTLRETQVPTAGRPASVYSWIEP